MVGALHPRRARGHLVSFGILVEGRDSMDRLDVKRTQVLAALDADDKIPSRLLTVAHVMTVAPTCISANTPLKDLVRLMVANGFRHLLVTDSFQGLLGVISDRDLLRSLGPEEGLAGAVECEAEPTAARVMSTDLLTASPGEPLEEAVDRMVTHGVSCLPVVSGETLVGILTNTDLQVLLHQLLRRRQALKSSAQTSDEPLPV